jgi:transcriptional regulator with XRE-family HTH domain
MIKSKQEAAMDAIIKKIREETAKPGVTQTSIADRLNVHRGTITRWLNGERRESQKNIDELLAYMEALGIDPGPYLGTGKESAYLHVPWLEAEASMGGGSTVVSKKIISHLAFRADWLLQKGSSKKMAVINAEGVSMEPTIADGSVVLINEAQTYPPIDGKIYFVCRGTELFLKRLKVKDERVIALISDNGSKEETLATEDHFEILGRAIWSGKEL